MPKYFNNLNMNGNQIQNAVIQPLATDPSSPATAQIWFNNAAGTDGQGRLKLKLSTRTMILDDQYVGSVGIGTALTNSGSALAPVLNVQAATAGQVGYMSAAHYSLLAGATNSATPSTLVARDGSGNAAFNMLTISAAPSNGTDVVNKSYADSIAAGFDPKGSAVLATNVALPSNVYANGTAGVGATLTASANSALTSTLIDGTSAHTLALNDYVLIKNEATAANNGVYQVTTLGSGTVKWVLTRSTTFNTAAAGPGQISNGSFLSIEQGALAGTMWMVTGITDSGLTVGTTAINFSSFGASQVYTNGAGLSLSANTFSVNLTGVSTLETSSGALRVKSSANTGAPLLSGGTGNEAAYGPLNLAGGATVITGLLPKANGGFGVDVSTGLAQNLVAASPNGASGAVSFRALVAADLPTVGTAGTYTKVTTDAYGRVTASSTLAATDIPSLDFAKITTGIVPTTQGGSGVNAAAFWQAPVVQKVTVVAATTANVSLTAPGATIDGVTMTSGQRVLLTAQTTGSQNGLWVWNGASSTMTRPLDYPAASTVHAFYGITVDVLAGGTANAGSRWAMTTTGAITIDTTSTLWASIPTNIGGGTGLLPVTSGGTGSSTASGARTNLGAAGVYNTTLTCDGVATSFTITHSLNSLNAQAKVLDPTNSNEEVFPNVQYPTVNTCTIIFSQVQTNGVQFLIRVVG